MFLVKLENYRCDFDKYFIEKYFNDLNSLKNYLIKENSERDDTPKSSKYWSNPCGCFYNKTTDKYSGWFRTKRYGNKYSLWLKEVRYDNLIIFEESKYCSKKFYDFLLSLENELNKKEIYGDF